jgi:hypothetical protein
MEELGFRGRYVIYLLSYWRRNLSSPGHSQQMLFPFFPFSSTAMNLLCSDITVLQHSNVMSTAKPYRMDAQGAKT